MNGRNTPAGFFTLGIAGLFLAGFFLLVTFGAFTYQDAVAGQQSNNCTRSLLGYLSTCARSHDSAGAITCREENGPVLVLGDPGGEYALRLYQRDGQLLEDYARIDAPLDPAQATAIGETEVFQVEEEDGLFTVITDAGQVVFSLRSKGGGS